MKTILKLAFSATLATVLIFGLATITSDTAEAYASCPSSQCPSNLSNYVWDGTCIRQSHGCPESCPRYRDAEYPADKCYIADCAV